MDDEPMSKYMKIIINNKRTVANKLILKIKTTL